MNAEKNREPWYAQGDPWVLTQTGWEPEKNIYYETIFTQSNGYMGIRGYTEESSQGMKTFREGYLGGAFGHVDDAAMQQLAVSYPWPMLQMLTLPEVFGCAITLNGEAFSLAEGTIEFFSRSLNMRNGVLTRRIVWVSPKGLRTRLEFDRFLSAAVPHLAVQQIAVTPDNWSGEAELRFVLDGETPSYFRCGDRAMPQLPQALMEQHRVTEGDGGIASLTCTLRGTGHVVSVASAIDGPGDQVVDAGEARLTRTVRTDVSERETTRFANTTAVASSRDGVTPEETAVLASECVADALSVGYEGALTESEAVWAARWENSDVAIDGPARDQAYARYSAFSMLQMAPFHTDRMSIPARAYAFNRYHGLYYWDSETFLMPNYLHTQPEVAENLLSFRYRTVEGARRTAQNLKSPGICFPWMTDADEGNEQGPWGIGDYLWHQNADIAYAIDQYVNATGDVDFMVGKGLEIMIEGARFWMSRFDEDDDGVVHLHDTVGPDELDKHGRDNGYTSLLARRHLRLVLRWIRDLQASRKDEADALIQKLEVRPAELAEWKHAADRLAVPNVEGHNFPLQDEFLLAKEPLSFEGLTADEAFNMRHTHRVVKQADIILAMYLLQDEFTVDQMREAYDFYEPMTLHYSSLSYNTHSIIATKIGRQEQAYDYFMKAAGLDLDNLRDATKDGLHAAALGGTWQTIVYGFLGMRYERDGLVLDPHLPAAWKGISLSISYRGYMLKLRITRDENVIEVVGSESAIPAHLTLGGQVHELKDGLSIQSAATAVN